MCSSIRWFWSGGKFGSILGLELDGTDTCWILAGDLRIVLVWDIIWLEGRWIWVVSGTESRVDRSTGQRSQRRLRHKTSNRMTDMGIRGLQSNTGELRMLYNRRWEGISNVLVCTNIYCTIHDEEMVGDYWWIGMNGIHTLIQLQELRYILCYWRTTRFQEGRRQISWVFIGGSVVWRLRSQKHY